MKLIVGGLGILHVGSLTVLILSSPNTEFLLCSLLLGSLILALVVLTWATGSFLLLASSLLFVAAMAGLSTFTLFVYALGWWELIAWLAAIMATSLVLLQAANAWQATTAVLPIEVLVLRNKFTLGYTKQSGPAHVAHLPYREPFARLPIVTQELTHTVDNVDVAPDGEQGAARSQQISAISIEARFQLNAAEALRIFRAPSWQEHVADELRRSVELRDFLSALLDHSIWQRVFHTLVVQQIELAVRRAAHQAQLHPHELSARREAFTERVAETLRGALAGYGLTLSELVILRIDTAEAMAAQRGRVHELVVAAELRARVQQLEVVLEHIRRNGLPETPEMIESLLLFMSGTQTQLSLIRGHGADPDLALVPFRKAAS